MKLCECGCGRPAPISDRTDSARGYVPDHGEKEPWENLCLELRQAEGGWHKVPCKCPGLRLAYESGYEDAVNDVLCDGFPLVERGQS